MKRSDICLSVRSFRSDNPDKYAPAETELSDERCVVISRGVEDSSRALRHEIAVDGAWTTTRE